MPVGPGAEGSAPEVALRDEVIRRDDLTLQGLTRLAALAAQAQETTEDDPELEAQRHRDRATEAFSRFDYGGATTQLREALSVLRPQAVRASGRQRLASIHQQLALVLFVHGELGASVEEIRACIHLDPDCEPDPAVHPPELVALHEEVRGTIDDLDTGSLHIETTPPGARAALDGRQPGETPFEWDGVPPGRHYITLERDGYLNTVEIVEAIAGEITSREVTMTLAPRANRTAAALRQLETHGQDAEQMWRETAIDVADADILVMLESRDDLQRLAAFDDHGVPIERRVEGEQIDEDQATRWLGEVLPRPRGPWYGQWWFWTPVSLTLTGVIALGIYLIFRTPEVDLVGGTTIRE